MGTRRPERESGLRSTSACGMDLLLYAAFNESTPLSAHRAPAHDASASPACVRLAKYHLQVARRHSTADVSAHGMIAAARLRAKPPSSCLRVRRTSGPHAGALWLLLVLTLALAMRLFRIAEYTTFQ